MDKPQQNTSPWAPLPQALGSGPSREPTGVRQGAKLLSESHS